MATFSCLRAVMLDWAGTTVDHGSRAPVLAMKALFLRHGVALRDAQVRQEMGLLKRDHIRAILAQPEVATAWQMAGGDPSGEAVVEQLFAEFGPMQMEIIQEHSGLIEGVVPAVRQWQAEGLRIGTTTGYTRRMLAPVMEGAAAGGYVPEASVSADEVIAGRPAPWMLLRNMEQLGVYPPRACVKIGDTLSDVEEGKNAGMWTIGLTRSGNMVGLDASAWEQLPAAEQQRMLAEADSAMRAAGADFTAETLRECDAILRRIDEQLATEK